jgi:hypothetical protein
MFHSGSTFAVQFGISTVLFFLAVFPALHAQEVPESTLGLTPVYTESQEKEYKFYPGGKIGISMEVPGSLKIIGWDRGSVRMEAEKTVYSNSLTEEKARELLEKSPIRVRYNDTTSTIKVTGAPELKGLIEINLIVYVPATRTDLAVQMKKGDFVIGDVNGWVEATLAEGNLVLTTIDGYFSGKTQKGNISANLSGNRWNGQGFTAVTQDGQIDLILPENYSAVLQLDTRDGEITVDYPPQEVEGELMPPEITIQKKARQLKATIGDGGAPLHLGTQSGDISLRKQ